jgi:hypothetical protein
LVLHESGTNGFVHFLSYFNFSRQDIIFPSDVICDCIKHGQAVSHDMLILLEFGQFACSLLLCIVVLLHVTEFMLPGIVCVLVIAY